jgi:hypothetical protein
MVGTDESVNSLFPARAKTAADEEEEGEATEDGDQPRSSGNAGAACTPNDILSMHRERPSGSGEEGCIGCASCGAVESSKPWVLTELLLLLLFGVPKTLCRAQLLLAAPFDEGSGGAAKAGTATWGTARCAATGSATGTSAEHSTGTAPTTCTRALGRPGSRVMGEEEEACALPPLPPPAPLSEESSLSSLRGRTSSWRSFGRPALLLSLVDGADAVGEQVGATTDPLAPTTQAGAPTAGTGAEAAAATACVGAAKRMKGSATDASSNEPQSGMGGVTVPARTPRTPAPTTKSSSMGSTYSALVSLSLAAALEATLP